MKFRPRLLKRPQCADGKIVDKKLPQLEIYIDAAKQHGEDSEPVHEVGDLQSFLRSAWELFTPEQKLVFATRSTVVETMQEALGGIPRPDPVERKDLVAVFGEDGQHPDYPRRDWSYEIENNNTERTYWRWVAANIEMNTQDPSIHLDAIPAMA